MLGKYASQHGTIDLLPINQHGLGLHIRGLPHYPFMSLGKLDYLLPVIQPPIHANNGGMGCHSQNPFPHLLMETIHNRHNGNQGNHPQHDTEHGTYRDKGDKVVAALGTCIAQANKQF